MRQERGKIEGKSGLSLGTPSWPDTKGMYLAFGLGVHEVFCMLTFNLYVCSDCFYYLALRSGRSGFL